MNVSIQPAKLSGSIAAIPSKSDGHRLLILAALSAGETRIFMPQRSEDIDATIRCLRALGAEIEIVPDGARVRGITKAPESTLLDCGESGSTFRFLLPVAAALCGSVRFIGGGRLPMRPIGELMQAMQAHGVSFSADRLPFTTAGRLAGGEFRLPGNISSQYLTGLLLALPLLPEAGVSHSRQSWNPPRMWILRCKRCAVSASRPYVWMVCTALRLSGGPFHRAS